MINRQYQVYSNISVHGKTLSEHNVGNVLIALLVSCCWLFFKNDKKICPLSMFLQEDRELAVQYVNVACDENVMSNKNGINPLSFDNTFRENTMLEQDILDKDVFETEEEYKNRISQLPPVHLGFGILDLKQTDPYSGLAFPRFSLSQKDKIISADIKAFISEPEKEANEDFYDGEILAPLKLYKGKIYYDYNNVILKSETKEVHLTPIYWQPYEYETQNEFECRMEHLPILPIGVCKPLRQEYDMAEQLLPLKVSCFNFVQEIFNDSELSIIVDRHKAKQICQIEDFWRIYGKITFDGNRYRGTAEVIYNDRVPAMTVAIKEPLEKLNYLNGKYYHNNNFCKAVKWYRKAADQGFAVAENNLGSCYELGKGVERNYKEAVKWYNRAIAQGNAAAVHNLENLKLKIK